MAISPELYKLKHGLGWSSKRKAISDAEKAKKQKAKDNLSTLISLGLTLATGGAGLPATLSKIPQIAQVVDKVPKLAKLVKFLNATKATSRAGTYGKNILNKFIHRGIGDMLIPDTIRDPEKKMRGYQSDIISELAGWGKSFTKDSVHPWSGEGWDAIMPDKSSTPSSNVTIPFAPGKGSNQSTSYAGPLAPDPRAKVSIPSQGGQMFATTPNVTQGLFGDIRQKPSGYQAGGNPYYSLLNMLK